MEQGPLALGRRSGEKICLTIDPGVDTEKLLKHLLNVGKVEGGRVSIGIEAPHEVLFLRGLGCTALSAPAEQGARHRFFD